MSVKKVYNGMTAVQLNALSEEEHRKLPISVQITLASGEIRRLTTRIERTRRRLKA